MHVDSARPIASFNESSQPFRPCDGLRAGLLSPGSLTRAQYHPVPAARFQLLSLVPALIVFALFVGRPGSWACLAP